MASTDNQQNSKKDGVKFTHRTKCENRATFHPAMIELDRMHKAGELDGGRLKEHIKKESTQNNTTPKGGKE